MSTHANRNLGRALLTLKSPFAPQSFAFQLFASSLRISVIASHQVFIFYANQCLRPLRRPVAHLISLSFRQRCSESSAKKNSFNLIALNLFKLKNVLINFGMTMLSPNRFSCDQLFFCFEHF